MAYSKRNRSVIPTSVSLMIASEKEHVFERREYKEMAKLIIKLR